MPQEEMYPVKAVFQNTVLNGDILHCYSDKNDAEITLSNVTIQGRITTAISSHPKGSATCKEEYALIGRVETFPCPRDTEFGLKVTLKNGTVWKVSAVSYLTELTISEGTAVDGTLLVNSVETPAVPGTYTGKLVLSPKA